jgi:integrase
MRETKRDFISLQPKDFEAYHHFLKKRGLKTNTRRRKLITARSLFRYALTRKKIPFSPARYIKPPERRERLPWIPASSDIERFIAAIPPEHSLEARNRLLIRLLAETGIVVSELCALRWEDVSTKKLLIVGKRERQIPLSDSLAADFRVWRKQQPAAKYVFPGFNRYGPTTARMSSRAVEILFRKLSHAAGLPEIKPKSLRHFAVMLWLAELSDKEIQMRLGVNQAYSLERYKKLRNEQQTRPA